MATFGYEGSDLGGAPKRGEVEALTLSQAITRLREMDVIPLRVDRRDQEEPPRPGDFDAFTLFNHSLAELTRLGLPMPAALRAVAGSLRRGRLRSAIERVGERVKEGQSLDAALAGESKPFPAYYQTMIRAGLATGNLPGVLTTVARHTGSVRKLKRSVISALVYPCILVAIGVLLIGSFLAVFGSTLTETHRMLSVEPGPVATLVLGLAGSPAAMAGIGVGALAAVISLGMWMRRTVPGERFLFRIPLLGRIMRNLCMVRLFACLEALLVSKAPLPEAVELSLGASGSLQWGEVAEPLRKKAAEGTPLASLLREVPDLPAETAGILALSQESGRIEDGARQMHALTTAQVESESDTLYMLLFPGGILVVGGLLLLVVLMLMAPYFELLSYL